VGKTVLSLDNCMLYLRALETLHVEALYKSTTLPFTFVKTERESSFVKSNSIVSKYNNLKTSVSVVIYRNCEHMAKNCSLKSCTEALSLRAVTVQEVFKSDFYDTAPFHKVLGKCCVLFVKDYFKYKPEVSSSFYTSSCHLLEQGGVCSCRNSVFSSFFGVVLLLL